MAQDAAATPPVTLVTETRVRPEHTDDFRRWQEKVDQAIARQPGFIAREVLPPAEAQPDWVIIQRFTTVEAARGWLTSAERAAMLQEAAPWLAGHDDVHLVVDDATPSGSAAPVSVVISVKVRPGQEEAFLAWSRRLTAIEAEFPGYLGYRLQPPVAGVQTDWLMILRFDSEPHLQAWLNSPERQEMLQQAQAFITETHLRTVRTGFDAWFHLDSGAIPPPAWKQDMLVLVALYPVVFLFGHYVQTPFLMERLGLPFPVALFIGNVVGVLLLGQLVPRISHRFRWWINPVGDPARTNLLGAAIIVVIYGLWILLFVRF